jgi:hypothetical protein
VLTDAGDVAAMISGQASTRSSTMMARRSSIARLRSATSASQHAVHQVWQIAAHRGGAAHQAALTKEHLFARKGNAVRHADKAHGVAGAAAGQCLVISITRARPTAPSPTTTIAAPGFTPAASAAYQPVPGTSEVASRAAI